MKPVAKITVSRDDRGFEVMVQDGETTQTTWVRTKYDVAVGIHYVILSRGLIEPIVEPSG